jgi:hypothetical protein
VAVARFTGFNVIFESVPTDFARKLAPSEALRFRPSSRAEKRNAVRLFIEVDLRKRPITTVPYGRARDTSRFAKFRAVAKAVRFATAFPLFLETWQKSFAGLTPVFPDLL